MSQSQQSISVITLINIVSQCSVNFLKAKQLFKSCLNKLTLNSIYKTIKYRIIIHIHYNFFQNYRPYLKSSKLPTMNMRKNYQQDFQTISMERKNTVKKYSQPNTFSIYFYQERVLKHSISPNQTVGTLLKQVKQKLSTKIKKIIGLTSVDGNQLIDYTLKIKNFSLTNYPNNMNLMLQIKQDVYNDEQPTLNDFQFLKLLGSGISASVYLVRHKGNGILYALKQISKSYFVDYKRMEQVLREKKIMTDMLNDVPFTTKLYASFESQKFLNLLMEYYPGGQMFVHLQKRKLKQSQAKLYFAEMILTFQKLHSHKIIYRDLKPENIMIDFEGHARLGDYGLCKLNLQYYDLTHSYCGSQQYMAPQIRLSNGYNYSVDFYTLGSFIYQLVNGVPPYYNDEPLFFINVTQQFREIVQRLIQNNMHQRLRSFQQIKRMKWMKGINWKKIQQKQYQMPYKVQLTESYIGQEFKRQDIPIDAYEQRKFDKLLESFNFLSSDKGGISQCYNSKKLFQLKHKKSLSIQNSHNRSRKSQKSRNSSRDSNQSITKKKIPARKNLYTSQPLEYQRKRLQFSNKSKSKNHKTFHDSIQKQKSKSKKMEKDYQLNSNYTSQKLNMKKVKSSQNIHHNMKVLQKIFSPTKATNYRSPQKYKF